jgi:uncharacterized protein YbaA (DUF1428 family)
MATKKQSANYIDGFVFTVPKKNLVAYKKMAREAAEVWKQFGALDYKECMGEELKTKPMGGMKPLSFTTLTKAKPSETVWFSFITFKNKTHRNQVNKKVMDHFSKKYADAKDVSMPFDPTQMAYGGFSVEVSS